MVHTVFERVKVRIVMKEAHLTHGNGHGENDSSINLTAPIPVADEGSSHAGDGDSVVESPELVANGGPQEKITLQSFENRKSFDDERIVDNAPTTIIRPSGKVFTTGGGTSGPEGSIASSEGHDDEDEVYVKDAFLVFRAMCKLSIKTLPAEQIADLKSHGMRSKLLSLHLIHTILKSHMVVFVSPLSTIRSSSSAEATGLIHAVKQYLCLGLSRNAASAVGLVFEVCCEIFWLMISHMRVMLKVSHLL
jgi:brefeldin A-inhibited guanine nucleotide-exchange protein